MNKADPMRNMARCENLPRGGLRGVSEQLSILLSAVTYPTFLQRCQLMFYTSVKVRVTHG